MASQQKPIRRGRRDPTKNPRDVRYKKPNGKPNVGREVAKAEGAYGKDSRAQDSLAESPLSELIVTGTDVSIDASASWTPQTLESLSMGVVLAAIRRGWMDQLGALTINYPYVAYAYLYQTLITAMSGGTLSLQNAPLWYWYLTQAISPKNLRYKTGSISLTWDIPSGAASVVPTCLKPYSGGNLNFGNIEVLQPLINNFYQVITTVYDAGVAEAALKSLFGLFPSSGMYKVSPYVSCNLENDASAFAACGEEFGTSIAAGGIVTTIYNETALKSPLFSKLAQYQPTPNYRGWDRVQRSGGTASYLSVRLPDLDNPRQIHNQVPPQFKFYNFDEYMEVLSLILCLANESIANSQTGTVPNPLTLTFQQVQLLLRHTLMKKFDNTYAQDMQLSGPGLVAFSPLSAAVNGASFTATNMLLPFFLAENIRACGRKKVSLGKRKDSVAVLDYVPILAAPTDEILKPVRQYVWKDKAGVDVPLYAVLGGEIEINRIDLSYNTGVTTGYISTEGKEIETICATFNTYVKALSAGLSSLVDPDREKGINSLATVFTTLQQVYVPPTVQFVSQTPQRSIAKQHSAKKFFGLPPREKEKVGAGPDPAAGNDYFTNITPNEITSANAFLAPLTKYQKVMILPVCVANLISQDSSTLSARQVFQIEPYRLPYSSVPQTPGINIATQTMYDKHYLQATMDVRSPLAPPSEMEQDMMEAAKLGRGGFFTNLAGMFAEDVIGIPGGRKIAGAIGNAIGI